MADLIDRNSAIDSIEHLLRQGDELYPLTETDRIMNHAFEIAASCVYNMPSAQPDVPDTNVGDIISRQAAIDALDKRFDSIPMEQTTEILLLRKDLRNLPSAQPQRMSGKWTYGEDEYGIDGYHCDKCGFFVPWDYTHKFIDFIKDYHFCPHCGADMRGEQDG